MDYNNDDSPPSFIDSKDEIQFYKFRFLQKKEELSKTNQKIKILEKLNKKLLHKLNIYTITKINRNIGNNKVKNKSIIIKKENNSFSINNNKNKNKNKNNNSKEITPNEFKNLWECIIQTELIENFDFCINEYLLISYLCQDIILLVYNEAQSEIHNKLNQVLKCLNLDKLFKNKINLIYEQFFPFFREYSNYIFEFGNPLLNNIHKNLISIIKEYNYDRLKVKKENNNLENDSESNKLDKKMLLMLETKINEGHFDNLIKSFYKICLYMLLHDPTLSFNIDKYHERKYNFQYYNKNNFINVEGFGNELSPCILLLSPPLLKNKYPFNGLRSAVYIIPDPDKNIYSECEANKSSGIKEENNKNCLEEKKSEKILKKREEAKNINMKNNVLIKNNIINHNNNVILRNKKKIHNNDEFKIESFNFSTGFKYNKYQINNDLQNINNDKLIISNSLGDIFNKNEIKENKDKNFNKKYKNKNISKENSQTKKSYIPNMNFISIKHFSKNSLILPNEEEETYIHNFNNDYIINNNKVNKTPEITKKSENIYKTFHQSINIDNELIDTDEERYIHKKYNNSNENNININRKRKIFNSMYNKNKNIINNKIENYKKSYSTIINPDNYLKDQYYSEMKYVNNNKLNPNLYISYDGKPFRKSNNEISFIENKMDSNKSNLNENRNYNHKHSFNTIAFNSIDNNNYEDFDGFQKMNNSNNFPKIKRNNIINYENIKSNNIENHKKRKIKSDKIKIIKNINNEKNINIYYLKNKKNFNINLNTSSISPIDNNDRFINTILPKISQNNINNMNRREEIYNNNNNDINKKYLLINPKQAEIQLYTINNNKIRNKKIKRVKNISQKFINLIKL